MKKLLAVALAALMLVASLASCANNLGDPDAIGDYTPEVKTITTDKGVFTFEEALGDTAILVGYNGKATKDDHVEIPTEFNGRPVVGIGKEVFYNLAAVVEVKIPDTVTSIGDYAFAGCTELTSITLPEGTLTLGTAAFQGCTKLETINVGKALTTIGNYAFMNCPVLTDIALPATLEKIGDYAFAYDKALTTFAAPEALTEIGTLAFYECTGLTSIKLSDNITSIGDFAFVSEATTFKSIIDMDSFTSTPDAEGKLNYVATYVDNMAATEVEDETGDAEEGTATEEGTTAEEGTVAEEGTEAQADAE